MISPAPASSVALPTCSISHLCVYLTSSHPASISLLVCSHPSSYPSCAPHAMSHQHHVNAPPVLSCPVMPASCHAKPYLLHQQPLLSQPDLLPLSPLHTLGLKCLLGGREGVAVYVSECVCVCKCVVPIPSPSTCPSFPLPSRVCLSKFPHPTSCPSTCQFPYLHPGPDPAPAQSSPSLTLAHTPPRVHPAPTIT